VGSEPAAAAPAGSAPAGVGHGTIRFREPDAAPAPSVAPEPSVPAEPEPEPQPEPAAQPAQAAAPSPAAQDLHGAYLAAASRVMAARAGAGNPEGDAELADAVTARDAAKAAWQAGAPS